jgi:hypothetical protein
VLSLDIWQTILLVCTALLALFALIKQMGKGVRYVWRMMKKFSELADQLLGDEKHPSLMQVLEETKADGQVTKARVERIEATQSAMRQQLDEHLEQGHPPAAIPIRPTNRDGRRGR